jgi:hypothetical protein
MRITFDDFAIQTGAGILIVPALLKCPDVVDALNRCLPDPIAGKYHFTPEQGSKFARAILAASIRHDYTKHVRFV